MKNFIEDSKQLKLFDYLDKYKHSFLIQISDINDLGNGDVDIYGSTVNVGLQETISKSEKMQILDIIPLIKKGNNSKILQTLEFGKKFLNTDFTNNNFIEKIKIGRGKFQDIVLNSKDISRNHACFYTNDYKTYFISDLNSSNGTFVNSKKLNINELCELKSNDIISFSNFLFRYFESDSAYFTLRIFWKTAKI